MSLCVPCARFEANSDDADCACGQCAHAKEHIGAQDFVEWLLKKQSRQHRFAIDTIDDLYRIGVIFQSKHVKTLLHWLMVLLPEQRRCLRQQRCVDSICHMFVNYFAECKWQWQKQVDEAECELVRGKLVPLLAAVFANCHTLTFDDCAVLYNVFDKSTTFYRTWPESIVNYAREEYIDHLSGVISRERHVSHKVHSFLDYYTDKSLAAPFYWKRFEMAVNFYNFNSRRLRENSDEWVANTYVPMRFIMQLLFKKRDSIVHDLCYRYDSAWLFCFVSTYNKIVNEFEALLETHGQSFQLQEDVFVQPTRALVNRLKTFCSENFFVVEIMPWHCNLEDEFYVTLKNYIDAASDSLQWVATYPAPEPKHRVLLTKLFRFRHTLKRLAAKQLADFAHTCFALFDCGLDYIVVSRILRYTHFAERAVQPKFEFKLANLKRLYLRILSQRRQPVSSDD